jgi:glycosyltransferase involved in cell wall biosynthesis
MNAAILPAQTEREGAAAPAHRAHICFVAPALYPVIAGRAEFGVVGGAEVQQAFIARQLVARGYRVSVISQDYGQRDGEMVQGMRVLKTFRSDQGLPGVRAIHPRFTGLWAALRRADADVYYQRSSAMTTGVMSVFCRRHGRRCIYAGAADVDFIPGREKIRASWYRAMFRYGLRHVDRVIVQNASQVQAARANHGIEPVLVPSMFVPPVEARATAANREVLWCGMMREVKRPDLFLELARRMPEVPFRMVGGPVASADGRQAWARIRREAAALPNLHLDGFLPYEVADALYPAARVFVNTSVSEGFPNTFLQAWSRGVPTLAFVDVGTRAQGEPVSGVCRDIDDMHRQLSALLTDEVAWTGASQRVRKHFEAHHSVEATMAAYEHLIGELQRGGGIRRGGR